MEKTVIAGLICVVIFVVWGAWKVSQHDTNSSTKDNTEEAQINSSQDTSLCPYPLKEVLVDSYIETKNRVTEFTVLYPDKSTDGRTVTEPFKNIDLSEMGFNGLAGQRFPFELAADSQTPACLFISFNHRNYATLLPARIKAE
ncbi:hypothetical protein HN958_00750 [Candidatus Falkowbacteria bacterium]|nr:hypothetical protein [Candidatus Falkowbacteria bacterium]